MSAFKPLLTPDERHLPGPERRALRRERRAELGHKTAAQWVLEALHLDTAALRRAAAEEILRLAGDALPGPDRMLEVLDTLIDRADEWLTWTWAGPVEPLLELLDGQVLRALIRPIVQEVYDDLRRSRPA